MYIRSTLRKKRILFNTSKTHNIHQKEQKLINRYDNFNLKWKLNAFHFFVRKFNEIDLFIHSNPIELQQSIEIMRNT